MFDIHISLSNGSQKMGALISLLQSQQLPIEGFSGDCVQGIFSCHLTTRDLQEAMDTLQDQDIPIAEVRPVLVIEIADMTKRVGEVIHAMEAAGIRIDFFYQIKGEKLVLGINDINRGMHAYLTHLILGKHPVS